MSRRCRILGRWRGRAAAVVAATALVVLVPTVAAAPVDDGPPRVLNALGGGGAGSGLRVAYASGQMEVILDGEHQLATAGLQPGARLAAGNHFSLAVGGTVISDVLASVGAPNALPWETISSFQSYGTVFSTFTPPAALAGFNVFVTVSYTTPGDRVSVRARVDVPAGTTEPVRLYWVGQPGLAGADAYAVPEQRLVGAFAPRPTDPVTYRAITVEEGLGQPYQHLVGSAACPYVVADGCPAGSGFVASGTDLPDAVVDVVDAPLSFAVEYGPLAPGRSDVGFELGFLTLPQPPVAPPPPPTTVPPPTSVPPPTGPTTPTTTTPTTTTTTTVPPPTSSTVPPTGPTAPTLPPPSTAPPSSTTTTTRPPATTTTTRPGTTTTTTRPGTTTTTTRPGGTTTTTRPGTTTTTRPGPTTTTTAAAGPPSGTTTTRPR